MGPSPVTRKSSNSCAVPISRDVLYLRNPRIEKKSLSDMKSPVATVVSYCIVLIFA